MEKEREFRYAEERDGEGEVFHQADPAEGSRKSPTWRGFLLAVLAAILLSVSATLLLGGSFGFGSRLTAAGNCASGGTCCPPAAR